MTTDFTSKELVHTIAGAAEVAVERDHVYPTAQGPLEIDLYRPPGASAPRPAVVFVSGYPDPGMAAMVGKRFKDWASYQGWARMVAASGMIGITYANRTPADVTALLHHLQDNAAALGIDPGRIAVWACSGNVPTALGLLARERIACAALLYGYMMDLDGATNLAQSAARFHFAAPPVGIEDLPPTLPMLVVRAGRDEMPGLNDNLDRFLAAAAKRGLAVTGVFHPEGPHSFDLVDDSPRTHEVIEEVLAFLRRTLA